MSSVADIRAKFIREGKTFDDKMIEEERKRLILQEGNYQPPMKRIKELTKDKNHFFLLAILTGLVAGVFMPLAGWFLVDVLEDYGVVGEIKKTKRSGVLFRVLTRALGAHE